MNFDFSFKLFSEVFFVFYPLRIIFQKVAPGFAFHVIRAHQLCFVCVSCWFSWLGESVFDFDLKIISNWKEKTKSCPRRENVSIRSCKPADISTAQYLTDWAANANLPKARKIYICIRICPHRMHVRFHAIQRSDHKIDDRFKQRLMTNQSQNLQKIVSIN